MSWKSSQETAPVGISRFPREEGTKKDMLNARVEGKTLDASKTFISESWTWKPLASKNSHDVYFAGTKVKRNKWKTKENFRASALSECEQEHCIWNPSKIKEIFPKSGNQEELTDDCTEEIQYLNLADCKVYTKKVPKKIPPAENLWKAADFPSMKIDSGVLHDVNEIKNKHAASVMKCTSVSLKSSFKKKVAYGCEASRQDKICISTSCQTDYSHFLYCLQDVNAEYLYTNLPPDLRNILLKYLFERDECKRLILHLLKLLSDSSRNTILQPPVSSLLSQSEKERILSLIF